MLAVVERGPQRTGATVSTQLTFPQHSLVAAAEGAAADQMLIIM